jgi:Zn-dependent peptidase ImmA (M78 family)/DNA-binding XRE family transcriptional regulator
MPRTTQAFITHRVLRWARERHNATEAEVAKRLSTSPDKVRAWETETSDTHPTFRQAQNIAGILKIPLGYLFLSAPPALTTELPDLRTVSGQPIQNPSPDFLDQLYDVQRKQEWFREYQEARGAEALPFVGRFPLDAQPDVVARDIREVIGVDDDMRREAGTWEAFRTSFVRKAEAAGVLVFRSGVVAGNNHRALSVDEFRGFAIIDDLAPVVFINTKDYKVAQTFTLAHELAHLWIGEGGVSNLNYAVRSGEQANHIDRLCDKIAAEVLVPMREFVVRWDDTEDTPDNLRSLARHYRVSRFVVLRRAYEADVITRAEFDNNYEEYINDHYRPADEGGAFFNLFFARNSTSLSYALLSATAEGQVSRLDAAHLLNVRVETVEKARAELFGPGIG